MQTYLFYDIETTGLNKAFDQVLHFAAIRTDLNLKELGRHEFKIKLNCDVIPSPKAMVTHLIGLKETAAGMSEIDAIKQIHRLMNEPGTISIGYNTLGFDDEFLRFSFYRNLLPPYTHQYANQCSRMDLYPIAIMYFLYRNPVLKWPQQNGKTSLKLEHINNANQFISGRSHHAMVDVEVTLALAKQFLTERDMWEYVTAYFNKQKDQERCSENPEGLMILGKFGTENYYQAPVLSLGNHKHYKNQTLWLRLDTAELSTTTETTIADTTWVMRKKWSEPGFVLPRKERFLHTLTAKRQALVNENKDWLKNHPDLHKKIIKYHSEYTYPNFPNTDIDASLYLNGFWSDADNMACQKFHSAQDKAQLVEKINNTQLRTLATRLLGRHYSDKMTKEQAQLFTAYLQQINPTDAEKAIIDYRGEKRLTPQTALKELAELQQDPSLTPQQLALLNELEAYLNGQFGVSL